MKKIILLVLPLVLFLSPSAYAQGEGCGAAGVSAQSMVVSIYKVYVSTDPLCTNPVVVYDAGSTPNPVDLSTIAAELGSGTLDEGTYKCLISKSTDTNRIVPAASTGDSCVAGQSYDTDVCWNYDPGTPVPIKNPETGEITYCTDEPGDIIWVYFSTYSAEHSSACSDCDDFVPPTSEGDAKHGLPFSAFTLSRDMTATINFNLHNKICSDVGPQGPRCGVEPIPITITVE